MRKKILYKLVDVGMMILFFPVVLVARLIRPFKVIRFGGLYSSRIGHFGPHTELYLCDRELNFSQKDGTMDWFFHYTPVCNEQLKIMWERSLNVSPCVRWLDRLNRFLPGGDVHTVPEMTLRDTTGLYARTKPHLSFTSQEEDFAEKELRRIGIPAGAKFVCFHARTAAYLSTFIKGNDFNYHNYRDSDIENYIPAMKALVERGYYVVRMGAAVEGPLPTDDSRVINYATVGRTDFMDIYLGAKCHFFVCDTAGIYGIAAIFRRPIAWVNFIPLEHVHTWDPDSLSIPKKLFLQKEERFLSHQEIIETGVGRFLRTEEYEKAGLSVIENSPQEIQDLVLEMDDRLNHQWVAAEGDDQRQDEFRGLLKGSDLHGEIKSKIGAKFLREHISLLEKNDNVSVYS